MKRLFALFYLLPVALLAQPGLPFTAYTYGFLTNRNAASARSYLGIAAGSGLGDVIADGVLTNDTVMIGSGVTGIHSAGAAAVRTLLGLSSAPPATPPPLPGGGETSFIYVDIWGDDANAGSRDAPLRTLTAAMALKTSTNAIIIGPGTFDFTVTDASSSTETTNRVVSNFAIFGSGKGITFINVIPRGTNEHNRVLSSPSGALVTNVIFYGFTLDGNASDYAWDTGGKLDWYLQGKDILVDSVEVIDFGGHNGLESFTPIFQDFNNVVVRNSKFHQPGSVNVTGPTAGDGAGAYFIDNTILDYNIAFGLYNTTFDVEISHNDATNVVYFFNYDTATAGSVDVRILDNRASGAWSGGLRGIQSTYGARQWWRIERNTFSYFPQAIWIRSPDSSGTNYFQNGVIADNFIPSSTLLGISVGESTNSFFRNNKIYYNGGSFPATNYVAGSNNYGWGHVKPDGSLWADLPNTLQGAGGGITYTGSANNGNLATSVDTLQELNDAVDNLALGGGSISDDAYNEATWNGVTTTAPSKNAVRDVLETKNQTLVVFNDGGTQYSNPNSLNFGHGLVVTDNDGGEYGVSLTNDLLTLVTSHTLPSLIVTGNAEVQGSLILSGSGGGGMDSLQVTNKFTNSVLTATRVVYVGSDEALTDDAGLTYDGSTDTLTSGSFVAGATNVIGALAGKQATLTDSSGLRGALSDESGTGVALFDGATLALNLASTANTSVSNVINMDLATSIIAVGGNIAYIHATNGAAGTVKTHVASFPNWSGGNVTFAIPSGWKTNVYSAVPANLTNGTVTRMFVTSLDATGDSANQTNVLVSFEYYK